MAPRDKVRVIVVDDDEFVLRTISHTLRDKDYECVTFTDGASAIETLRQQAFDVAIIDLAMPEVDGFQVLEALQRDALPVTPLVLTGMGNVDNAVRALKLGAFDFLQKPVDPNLLLQSIGRAVDQRSTLIENERMRVLLEDWESMFNASPQPAFAIGLDGNILHCNEAVARLVAKTPESLRGADCHNALCSDRHSRQECPFLGGATAHLVQPAEFDLWNGIYQVFSAPLEDALGNVYGRSCGAYDLTERKHAELALRESEEYLRKAHGEVERLLTSMSSFLIGLGTDLRISRWNAAAETTFGISREEAIGKRIDTCGIRWDWNAIVGHLSEWPAVATQVRLQDVRYQRTDGSDGLLGVTVNPVKDAAGAYEVCFLLGTDVTERRNLEVQLVQAQKLEAVGRLAAGIAHEINTPTQYVGDNIEFLQMAYESLSELVKAVPGLLEAGSQGPIPSERHAEVRDLLDAANLDYLMEQIPKAIEQSMEGVGRISSIVQAMKEFSHPGSAEKTYVDLNQCIRSTVTVSRNEWKYVSDVELDLAESLPFVNCLPGELNQVFLNVIVNAAHAIGDAVGGGGAEAKGKITIGTRQNGDWCEIRISDTGAGIPEGIRERIFDPFFTTKEVGRGTGQGLAIARNVVVDKHGGAIAVDSVVGKGTTFTIRLPING